jgi:hypothetical protein
MLILLLFPLLSRNAVNFDDPLVFHKQQRKYVSQGTVRVRESESLCFPGNKRCFTNKGGILSRRIALELQKTRAQQKFPGGDPLACTRPARNPLGETLHWVMKASSQRDYIGVHGKRVMRQKAKESCRDWM